MTIIIITTHNNRYRPVPCAIKELPAIDAVCISHNHYDHLDIESVRELHRAHPGATFFVGMGTRGSG